MSNKIKVDYGMPDFYKFYTSQSKSPVERKVFNKIVSEFNQKIVEAIIEKGLEFTPVNLQFTFCVRKSLRIPKIKDGKLVNTSPIDYKTTKELWARDPEAAEKKILIRYLNNHTAKNVFRIKALKTGFNYTNKKFYKFKPCRSFQRLLAKRILDGNKDNFDAYNLY